jgi:hypothetical protein
MIKQATHIYFSKNKLFKNFEMVYDFENSLTFTQVFKAIYKDLALKYPKYFKMDSLSKLGFLATEVLLKDRELKNKYQAEEIGVLLGNSASTYIMDSKHQESLNDREAYFPSPANFVYTLPNIMTGEICIRNKFQGENAVFISPSFDTDFLFHYAEQLFEDQKLKACILGYVDIKPDFYEAFLVLVEDENRDQFKLSKLKEIYNKYKII